MTVVKPDNTDVEVFNLRAPTSTFQRPLLDPHAGRQGDAPGNHPDQVFTPAGADQPTPMPSEYGPTSVRGANQFAGEDPGGSLASNSRSYAVPPWRPRKS